MGICLIAHMSTPPTTFQNGSMQNHQDPPKNITLYTKKITIIVILLVQKEFA
jgi:hypothetical protein